MIKVAVADNAAVKQGDGLFAIDPAPYQLRVDLARAEAAAAQSEVDQGGRNIAGERANATVADEQIRRARDNLSLAQQSLDRLAPLLPKGYVTEQQVDQARPRATMRRVSLRQAEAQSSGANQVVGTLETRRAQLAAAQATAGARRTRPRRHRGPRAVRRSGHRLSSRRRASMSSPASRSAR